NKILLSESGAKKMINETIVVLINVKLDNNELNTLSDVTKDYPKHSTIRYDWLIDIEKLISSTPGLGYEHWGNNSVMTLVQLKPTADIASVNKKLKYYIEQKRGNKELVDENFLYPMERWKMYNVFKQGIEQDGKIKSVRLFTSIAWLVLLIACINFMNLSTARSEKRAKEVSMRKIVGAKKSSLIMHFLGESIVFAFVAGILAIGMVKLGLPTFNTMVNKELAIDFGNWQQIGFISAIILVVGIISGSYPAFFLSSFDPLTTLKGGKRKAGSS